jgi:hypothetical protein
MQPIGRNNITHNIIIYAVDALAALAESAKGVVSGRWSVASGQDRHLLARTANKGKHLR